MARAPSASAKAGPPVKRRLSRAATSAKEPYAHYVAIAGPHAVVIDTNVLIDVLNNHPVWALWSLSQLAPQFHAQLSGAAEYRRFVRHLHEHSSQRLRGESKSE